MLRRECSSFRCSISGGGLGTLLPLPNHHLFGSFRRRRRSSSSATSFYSTTVLSAEEADMVSSSGAHCVVSSFSLSLPLLLPLVLMVVGVLWWWCLYCPSMRTPMDASSSHTGTLTNSSFLKEAYPIVRNNHFPFCTIPAFLCRFQVNTSWKKVTRKIQKS